MISVHNKQRRTNELGLARI